VVHVDRIGIVETGNPPEFGTRRRIYAAPLDWGRWSRSFDLDPREDRILVETLNTQSEITVLLNWQALLRK
jgi:hypothetical protein